MIPSARIKLGDSPNSDRKIPATISGNEVLVCAVNTIADFFPAGILVTPGGNDPLVLSTNKSPMFLIGCFETIAASIALKKF